MRRARRLTVVQGHGRCMCVQYTRHLVGPGCQLREVRVERGDAVPEELLRRDASRACAASMPADWISGEIQTCSMNDEASHLTTINGRSLWRRRWMICQVAQSRFSHSVLRVCAESQAIRIPSAGNRNDPRVPILGRAGPGLSRRDFPLRPDPSDDSNTLQPLNLDVDTMRVSRGRSGERRERA